MLLRYRALVYVSGHGHTALQFCNLFSARTVRPSNVKVYIAAVRRWRLELGHTDRVHEVWLLRRVLQGIDRSNGSQCSRPRLPISMADLRLFIDAYRSNTTLDIQENYFTRLPCCGHSLVSWGVVSSPPFCRLIPGWLCSAFLMMLKDRPQMEESKCHDRNHFAIILRNNHRAASSHRNLPQHRPQHRDPRFQYQSSEGERCLL